MTVASQRPALAPGVVDPAAATSQWTAAARARESGRPDRLFDDPLAAALAGPGGFALLERLKSAAWSDGPELYPVVRTRFFDDHLQAACRGSAARQVVMVAAGQDTRAFRLPWPAGTRVFELDRPEVLRAKADVIASAGTQPRCERRTVGVDLCDAAWPEALIAHGYRPELASVWLVEGLLYYLTAAVVDTLLARIAALMAPASSLALDVMSASVLYSPLTWGMRVTLARLGAPGRFGTDIPTRLLARHGYDAEVTQPGAHDAHFVRWTAPVPGPAAVGVPRCFLVRARRT